MPSARKCRTSRLPPKPRQHPRPQRFLAQDGNVGISREIDRLALLPVRQATEHPFDQLARLRFRVTVNTDNRLMSDTTMSREMFQLVETFGYGWIDLERFTINAMKSAFIHFDERLAIIDEVIKPRYAALAG